MSVDMLIEKESSMDIETFNNIHGDSIENDYLPPLSGSNCDCECPCGVRVCSKKNKILMDQNSLKPVPNFCIPPRVSSGYQKKEEKDRDYYDPEDFLLNDRAGK